MIDDPEQVAHLPWVQAIHPVGSPYFARLSQHSDLHVWHVDVEFQNWPIPPELAKRWRESAANIRETWRKRPLAVGEASGCTYSCGEVEIAARLRKAGYQSQWISEWSGYPHVDCWKKFCVKRSEIKDGVPELWAFDHNVRMKCESRDVEIGKRGGHPDVAAWKIGDRDFVFIEYKGPGDKINKKQDLWARAVLAQNPHRLAYVAVKGTFSG